MDTIDLLAKEYIQLQSTLERFDDRALLIKGWSVTVSLAGLAKAIELKNSVIVRLSALAALLFWLIEAIWKSFQQSFEPRIEAIETAFRAKCQANPALLKLQSTCPDNIIKAPIEQPFQIHTQWYAHWHDSWWYQVPWHMIQPPVFLPHAIVVCIAIYLVRRFDTAKTG